MNKWFKAFRLRTLPLSLACVGMGSFLAVLYNSFQWVVCALTILTTIFLQVLSNLANDYGDFVNGADHDGRKGPSRTVQSGEISPAAMKRAIWIFVGLSLISGLLLLYLSIQVNVTFLIFFLLGLGSIAAAIYYTMGSSPYGYAGLGDLSVFVFFGLVAVLGTFFLNAGHLHLFLVLPAISCGLFSVGVLNVNNIRDIFSDKEAGKKSIPVRIGRKAAVRYHWALLVLGFAASVVFVCISFSSYFQFLFLLSAPLFFKNGIAAHKYEDPADLDPYLKQLAISTLLFVLLFGAGCIIASV